MIINTVRRYFNDNIFLGIHFFRTKIRKVLQFHDNIYFHYLLNQINKFRSTNSFLLPNKESHDLIKDRNHKNIGIEQARAIAHTLIFYCRIRVSFLPCMPIQIDFPFAPHTFYYMRSLEHRTLFIWFMLVCVSASTIHTQCTRIQATIYLFWPLAHAYIIPLL